MMNTLAYQSIENALEINEGGKIKWMANALPCPDSNTWNNLDRKDQTTFLRNKIQNLLYDNFYVQGVVTTFANKAITHASDTLTPLLNACHNGKGYWEEGWELIEKAEACQFIKKEGITIQIPTNEELLNSSIFMPSGRINLSPGFYSIIGDAGYSKSHLTLCRFYFNVFSSHADEFTQLLVSELNSVSLPFYFKILNDAQLYERNDTAVLYISKSLYSKVRQIIEINFEKLAPYLNHSLPAFVKPIAQGIGIAEDPSNGESFGEHRCKLITNAILKQYFSEEKIPLSKLIEKQFEENNLDFIRPYLLSSQSEDIYTPISFNLIQNSKKNNSQIPDFTPLDISIKIGCFICERAIWYKNQCNWMETTKSPEVNTLAVSMSPSLYDGSAGLVWFLAELYEKTGEESFKTTAIAGSRQLLTQLNSPNKNISHSFYEGLTGALLTIIKVARLCHETELLTPVYQILKKIDESVIENKETDLLSGIAGTLCGITQLYLTLPKSKHLLQLIELLADTIIERVQIDEKGASWISEGNTQPANLCGISHGTSGIAIALIEAGKVLKTDKFQSIVNGAFRYEDKWYKLAGNKWPDLRVFKNDMNPKELIESTFWCTGAPGIALTRLYALNTKDSMVDKKTVNRNFKSTKVSIANLLDNDSTALSLCHGACGNAAILNYYTKLSPSITNKVTKCTLDYLNMINQNPYEMVDLGYFTGLAGMGSFFLNIKSNTPLMLLFPFGNKNLDI